MFYFSSGHDLALAPMWRLTTETAVGFSATNDWKRFQSPKKRKKIPDIGFENILQDIKNDPIPLKWAFKRSGRFYSQKY